MTKLSKKITVSIIIFFAIIYGIGVLIFSNRSYPNTYINDKEKGFISSHEVFIPEDENKKIELIGRDDKKLTIDSKSINLKKEISGKPELKQNPFLWPVEIFQRHDYDIEYLVDYNKNKLRNELEKSELFTDIIEPKDAYINKTDTGVSLEKEVIGNKLDKEKTINFIEESLRNDNLVLDLEDQYINPKVTSDDKDLKDQYEKLSSILKSNYNFDFEDRNYELKGQELLSMYVLENKEYKIDRARVREYVKNIAIETDTYAREHKFKATDIGEITVPGGIYGWQMNVDKTTDNLIGMIENKKSGDVEIEYNRTAKNRGINDIGDTYIEIDLSRQHMWFYKDGELVVNTDVVTGDARKSIATTPTGVNQVWSKEQDRFLNGYSAISGNRYSFPVKYWIPVGWTGSGIHDTYNRSEYGGDIYKTNGSSSCINTPLDKMEKIFKNVPLNTAVVIYESSTNYSPSEFERQEEIRKGEAKMDVS